MTLQNAFSELSTEETVQSLRLIVSALSHSIGLITPDAVGRMRVSLDTAPATLNGVNTVTTVTGVGTVNTVSNQTQLGGYNANDQIPALMHLSADSLRRNITIT